jgi:hypothetical protein
MCGLWMVAPERIRGTLGKSDYFPNFVASGFRFSPNDAASSLLSSVSR